ncbi:MAG: sugar nucleotide-binding protein [Chloroflexota bacterium]
MRVAVVGVVGRLGSALVKALEEAPFTGFRPPVGWDLPEFNLDTVTEASFGALLDRERPEVVIHTAAWTDVDGNAREPDVAMRRNGTAVGEIARACAARGVDLVIISTNEVFDGRRTDGLAYRPDDPRSPINAYGAAKAAAEQLAADAFAGSSARLAIVRTAWLFGPPGNDFPAKIAAAALRAQASGDPLRVTGDEIGTPTYTPDLAEAIVEIVGSDDPPAPGSVTIHHCVNGGRASRADWARDVLRQLRIEVEVVDVPASTWQRASTPPLWAVLEPTPLPGGIPMRDWREAFADALPALRREVGR